LKFEAFERKGIDFRFVFASTFMSYDFTNDRRGGAYVAFFCDVCDEGFQALGKRAGRPMARTNES